MMLLTNKMDAAEITLPWLMVDAADCVGTFIISLRTTTKIGTLSDNLVRLVYSIIL